MEKSLDYYSTEFITALLALSDKLDKGEGEG
jgi:hypothetical protein